MSNRLRSTLFSVPVLTAVGLFALYLAFGFFALPAILKWQFEKQVPEELGHRISIGEVHFNPLAFKLEVGDLVLSDPGGGPMLGFKRLRVDLELRSMIDRAWTFAQATLDAPVLHLKLDRDGRHNFSALRERLRDGQAQQQAGTLPRFVVQRLALTDARIEFSDGLLDEPLVARIEPLSIEVDNLSSLPEQAARFRVSARTVVGETLEANGELALNPVSSKGRLALNGVKVVTLARGLSRLVALDSRAGTIDFATNFDLAVDQRVAIAGSPAAAEGAHAGARATLDRPKLSIAGVRLASGPDSLTVPAGVVEADRVTMLAANGGFELALDAPRAAAPEGLSARRGVAVLEVRGVAVQIGRVAVDRNEAAITGAIDEPKITATGVSVSGSAQSAQLREVSFAGQRLALQSGSSGPSGIKARLDDAALRLAAVGVVAQGASAELGRVSGARFGAKSLVLDIPEGRSLDLSGDGLSAALSDAVVRSPTEAAELLRLGSVVLSGGVLSLKDRSITAEKLAISGGKATTGLDAGGTFNWLSWLHGAGNAAAGPAQATLARQTPSAPWRLAVKSAQLDGFALGFEDRRASPVLAVGLAAIRARLAGLDTGSATPMRAEFQAKVGGGGQIEASGQVRADNGMSDLKLKAAGIALAPVQTYLSQFAALRLASGTLSAEGRLRYGGEAGAKLAYKGGVAVDHVLLEELAPSRPFLGWDSVATSDLVLTLAPNRVDIGELRVSGPSGRVIIAEDRTVNLKTALKKPGERKVVKPGSAQPRESGDDIFPVTIARVRVSGGAFEFADLSLTPQFATRMHDLKGVISGLGSDANGIAKLQLDARVDSYGSAKIRGQISVSRPEKFTEVDVEFRNLEMTSLSPYVAKFAGYRVAGGRLALDLRYKVREGKLLGENKIVLNKLELGEKVDSPNALDLPLALAIAVLKDSNGVIDVGLPVSGDLDDPKFDYGALIGKAIGNLLGSIVTAPFRALGALFGGGEKAFDTIDFEPGGDAIAPPERQKLEAVARALRERPALMLVVPPTYAAGADTRALKSLVVRTDIVRRMGVKLLPGEDPGPIDTANPRVQRAVENAFGQRYAPDVLAALKGRADHRAAPAFHQSLVDRLIGEEPVSEPMLAQLAARRGAAIVRELTTAGGVPGARVALGEPRKASGENDKVVTLRLELEVAK